MEKTKVKTRLPRCPKCHNQMVWKTGKYGGFLSCSDFPECRGKLDIWEIKTPQKQKKELRKGERLEKQVLRKYHDIKKIVWKSLGLNKPSNFQFACALQRHYIKTIDSISEVKLAAIWYADNKL